METGAKKTEKNISRFRNSRAEVKGPVTGAIKGMDVNQFYGLRSSFAMDAWPSHSMPRTPCHVKVGLRLKLMCFGHSSRPNLPRTSGGLNV